MQKSQFLLILTVFGGANHGYCVKSKKKVFFFILTWIALKKDTPQENLNTHPKNQAIQVTPTQVLDFRRGVTHTQWSGVASAPVAPFQRTPQTHDSVFINRL